MKKLCSILLLTSILTLTAFTHRPLTWVAIGDSITYLNDHTDETGHRVTRGYLSDVTDRLPYIHYSNQGHNGWTTQNFAKSIDKLNIPVGDVYTVFLGTNDWWHSHRIGTWTDYDRNTGDTTIYGCMRVIIDKIRSLNKTAPIILITPTPRGDFVYINNPKNNAYGSYKPKDGQTLEQVAAAISDIGRHEGLRVLDLYHDKRLAVPHAVRFRRLKDPRTGTYHDYPWPDYTTIPFDPATDEYPYPPEAADMTFDGLHPSDKGNAEIARRLARILKHL
ncbi:MAG TPA: SGNH/GDSL hydrolase family protein [Puia sp.]|nr:SGNH/GDSL hydrolase family protein [Puia sp.]